MRRLPRVLSWTAGILLALVALLSYFRTTRSAVGQEIYLVALLLTGLPFVVIRRRPVLALGLLLSGLVTVHLLIGFPYRFNELHWAQIVAIDIGLGFVAATQRSSVTRIALAATIVVQAGIVLFTGQPDGTDPTTFATQALAIVAAALIGNALRQRRTQADRKRAQAEADAVVAERLRIAREVHDMVAHSIAVIAIQAGVGRRVMRTQPEEAGKALDVIETTSRQTLAGLRRTLGALRQGEASLDPLPGLGDLDTLVASAAHAGVTLGIRRVGVPRDLPEEIELSAYRIIQEAVSNVMRHAGTDRALVTVEYGGEELALEVADGGRGSADLVPGFGLTGMRERAEMLGGTFTAEPRPEGGFRVAATLPAAP